MTYRLAEILSSFASLAVVTAVAVVGIACYQHHKAGGNKGFGVTAWIALLYLLVAGIPYVVQWVESALALTGRYTPGAVPFGVFGYSQQIADGLWFAFFAAFTAGVWGTVRKLPRRSPDSPSEGQAAHPLD